MNQICKRGALSFYWICLYFYMLCLNAVIKSGGVNLCEIQYEFSFAALISSSFSYHLFKKYSVHFQMFN